MARLTPRLARCAVLVLLLAALVSSPASAQTVEPAIVRAVLFTSHVCTFCRQIVEQDLPPAIQGFGDQLQILTVDTDTPEGKQLYQAALDTFGVPRGVPLLFVDQTTLGGINIVPQFPALVETFLAQGGVDWPAIPGLAEYMALSPGTATPATSPPETSPTQLDQPTESSLVVRAVMFWMEGCLHCHKVIEDVLPPLQEKYGGLLDIRLVELATLEEVELLYQLGAAYDIPRGQVGVPFLIIGNQVLIGGEQIPDRLPGLIEDYLAAGGIGLPDIHPFADSLLIPTPTAWMPVVHLLFFWTSDCHACRSVVDETLPPLLETYDQQLVVRYVDVVSSEDVESFYQVAAAYGISKDEADLPMIVIGDRALVGSQHISTDLPGLVESYLAQGGVPLPEVASLVQTTTAAEATLPERPEGYWVAIGALILMFAALLYSVIALLWKSMPVPPEIWTHIALPILALIGLGVAGYLAYVETQAIPAVCGPVGDCNAVQASPYARLFGVLPIGVLGVIGYLMILAVWTWSRLRRGRLADLVPGALLAMTLFGTLFSIYLTYLELFVIKAVCMWCVTSAVIMVLLLLLSLNPARQTIRALQSSRPSHSKPDPRRL